MLRLLGGLRKQVTAATVAMLSRKYLCIASRMCSPRRLSLDEKSCLEIVQFLGREEDVMVSLPLLFLLGLRRKVAVCFFADLESQHDGSSRDQNGHVFTKQHRNTERRNLHMR